MSDFICESQCDEFEDYRPTDQDWAEYAEYLYLVELYDHCEE